MDKSRLRRLAQGVYSDQQGTVYLYIKEFLERHGMPDRPDVRQALMQQVRQEFGPVEIVTVEGEEGGN